LFTPTTFIPPFGTNFVPSVTTLSEMNYAPIPLSVALQQYMIPPGFSQRVYDYNHPGAKLSAPLVGRGQNLGKEDKSDGVWTLSRQVYRRGRFHPGKTYQWTHAVDLNGVKVRRVVPISAHTQRYTDRGDALK
jgi:hypothetical protein